MTKARLPSAAVVAATLALLACETQAQPAPSQAPPAAQIATQAPATQTAVVPSPAAPPPAAPAPQMAQAQPAAVPAPAAASWEDALLKCAPGAVFDDCVSALEAAKIAVRKSGASNYSEVSVELQPPFAGLGVRTYKKAGGKVVTFNVSIYESKGKGRKDLLGWLRKQVGSAKETRGGTAGGVAGRCGEAGWGVGWLGSKSREPEVQLQLSSPESTSASDAPERLKPEDALVKREGNGVVVVCFLLPPTKPGKDFIDAPEISVTAMKAFLASPRFHGKAALK